VPVTRESEHANHFPREIGWNPGMMALDPLALWPESAIPPAYNDFLRWFDRQFFPSAEADQDQ
jgi:hypothetical protein